MTTPGPAPMVTHENADDMDAVASHVVMARVIISTIPTSAITGLTRVQSDFAGRVKKKPFHGKPVITAASISTSVGALFLFRGP